MNAPNKLCSIPNINNFKYQMGLNVQSFQIQATLKKFFTPELCINKTKWALVVFFLKKKKFLPFMSPVVIMNTLKITCMYVV